MGFARSWPSSKIVTPMVQVEFFACLPKVLADAVMRDFLVFSRSLDIQRCRRRLHVFLGLASIVQVVPGRRHVNGIFQLSVYRHQSFERDSAGVDVGLSGLSQSELARLVPNG
jgi:hypothetical protein